MITNIIFVFLSSFFFSALVSAQVFPGTRWNVMRLPHFDLVFDAQHRELAEAYAKRLESSVSVLQPYFPTIEERTLVVLNDRTDLVNGYATPMPYSHMVIFPVLPGPMESISDYGDWFYELSLHEYSHILQFSPRKGLVGALHSVFGSWVTPNALLPRWWLEGMAVEIETRESEHGRLRSPLQDGIWRAYVLEERLKSIPVSEINETTIPTWPFGGRPYLFGSLLWSELAHRDVSNIGTLNENYGGRIPFFIEGPIVRKYQQNYSDIFEISKARLQEKVEAQVKDLKKIPPTIHSLIESPFLETYSPVVSPDGLKMIFLARDSTTKRSLNVLIRPNLETDFHSSQMFSAVKDNYTEKDVDQSPMPDGDSPGSGSISRFSWFSDSTQFVYDKVDSINRFQETSDLYLYSLKTKKAKKLTTGLRSREPSVSPDDKLIAFVQLDAGKTALAVFNNQDQTVRTVFDGKLQQRISFPVFVNKKQILFSMRDQGFDSLMLFDLDSNTVSAMKAPFSSINFLEHRNEKLYFSSNASGIYNLYEGKLNFQDLSLEQVKPLTHALTGYLTVSAAPKNAGSIYTTWVSSTGYKIVKIPSAEQQKMPSKLVQVTPLFQDRYPLKKPQIKELDFTQVEVSNYNSFKYLLPKYWFPNFGSTSSDGDFYGFMTGAIDPLQKQNYLLQAIYEAKPKQWSYIFDYQNNFFEPQIVFSIYDIKQIPLLTNLEMRWQRSSLDLLFDIPAISQNLYLGPNVTYFERSSDFSSKVIQTGPGLLLNYSDYSQAGSQISPESGQSLQLRWNRFLPGANSESFNFYFLHYQKYFSKWLPRRNAIYLQSRAQFIDNKGVGLSNYNTTESDFKFSFRPNPFYVMRGYPTGYFVGLNLFNYNLEYRFPIRDIYKSSGTLPVFVRRVHGALISDGINFEGFERSLTNPVTAERSYHSLGAELKLDLTLFYHQTFTLKAGQYWTLNQKPNEAVFALTLQTL